MRFAPCHEGDVFFLARIGHVLHPSHHREPTFEALLDHLRLFGFRFLRPVDVLRDPAGEIVQLDALCGGG